PARTQGAHRRDAPERLGARADARRAGGFHDDHQSGIPGDHVEHPGRSDRVAGGGGAAGSRRRHSLAHVEVAMNGMGGSAAFFYTVAASLALLLASGALFALSWIAARRRTRAREQLLGRIATAVDEGGFALQGIGG